MQAIALLYYIPWNPSDAPYKFEKKQIRPTKTHKNKNNKQNISLHRVINFQYDITPILKSLCLNLKKWVREELLLFNNIILFFYIIKKKNSLF